MATATLSAEFEIYIPKEIRDAQKWEIGQEFAFIAKGKGVLIMPVPTLDELRGLAEGANTENYRDRRDRM